MPLETLLSRAAACELCGATDDLAAFGVDDASGPEQHILACAICRAGLADTTAVDDKHWFCLQEAAWSEVPVVQVVAWRLLNRLEATWARELLDQLYLDDETLAWARAGATQDEPETPTLDCHGTPLADGDTVTLIKDLDVKGANFTAKRGTVVKKIRLGDDPGLVEGRVNKVGIYLKTEFIKKVH